MVFHQMPSMSMCRSETHLSQSLMKEKKVCSFTSSECVYESQNYLTTARYWIKHG